jgi:hypothetical protein
MRAYFRQIMPVGVLVLSLGAPVALAANSPIDPDPRSPSLGDMLAREEAARVRIERVVETAPLKEATPASAPAPAPVVRQGSVRQVHPVYAQPAVTVLVPGGKLAR